MIAYILAAGSGTRIAPYGECRPKTLLPVANRPVLHYLCDALLLAGIGQVVVAAAGGESDIRQCVAGREEVRVVGVGKTTGTAMSLLSVIEDDEPALVLFGDVLLDEADVKALAGAVSAEGVALLVAPLAEGESRDWISVAVTGGRVDTIVGHPRTGASHRVAGFALPAGFKSWLDSCPTYFPSVEVGMMPPAEHHLEAAVESYRASGRPVTAIQTGSPSFDLDKPWHILSANETWVAQACGSLTSNELAEGAVIDPSAHLDGHVRLGKGSRVGRNVVVRGNLIVGDNTELDAGAIINGNAIIGSNSFVGNACFIEDGSVVGDECVVSHAAELAGMTFRGVFLYHYMEIYGIVGERSDIGAATVCGSLRFDDGLTVHKIRGRRELPRNFANATFIGDYCRTGVNATIMPGKKIGPYSIVGA
ncbi:MAG: NTP transferase domain-containing protein, partial [Spirochaetaceae bacterium]|nr:NTP transferase domain-containing protein [Spirochaetaceae bacterium]